jgi:HD-like signal output (HDOD) protein
MLVSDNHFNSPEAGKTTENALKKVLSTIRKNEEFPSISKYLVEINRKLDAHPDTYDASELANVILHDYALTNKLLKLVNSAFYGLAAGKVTTVTRAVVVLGYENVRLATISVALFEHFQSKAHTADLKEALVGSFWSGLMARDIAKMDAGIDPEEAFVCAMMSQLGKLVMIYYLPDEYRKIVEWMEAQCQEEDKAVKAVCGLTYEDLGLVVAKQWNFPAQICEGMQALTRKELQSKRKPPSELRVLSNFLKELRHLIQVGGLIDSEQEFLELFNDYEPKLKISVSQLKMLIKDSVEKVRIHAQALDCNVADSLFIQYLSCAFQPGADGFSVEDIAAQAAQISGCYQLSDGPELRTNFEDRADLNPMDIIVDGIREISEAMMSEYDVNDIALMSLEIIYRALRFHRALIFVMEGKGQRLSVRFGYGQHSQRLTRKVEFNVTDGDDLFNQAIRESRDLIVADAYDANMGNLIPPWFRRYIDAPAFVFLPVLVGNVCIGAFYADRDKGGTPISDSDHRLLRMLRNQLILAVKYRRK